MADIISLGEALNSKVAEKAYDDVLSKPAKQVGEFAEDLLKTARLILVPVQLASAVQDRLDAFIQRAINKVPQERQIIPPLHFLISIYENIKYMDDKNLLYELFEELLARSIDSGRIKETHPSFIYIIPQLTPDEALILLELKNNDFEVVDTMDLDHENRLFVNRKIEKTTIPIDKLSYPDNIYMYYSHLASLSLVEWPVIKSDPIYDDNKRQIGIRRYSKMNLTEFGKFFVNACVPEGGFRNK